MGYLVWGEFGDWGAVGYGASDNRQQLGVTYLTQWLEALERDYSHPSIIGWCPLNETWQPLGDPVSELDDVTRGLFLATKGFDRSRPVLDASGYSHRVAETDVFDAHDYVQSPELLRLNHGRTAAGRPYVNLSPVDHLTPLSVSYAGQPFFVSEFGGIWWRGDADSTEDSWGYGERPMSMAEFYERFAGLCSVLLENEAMFGYCYTQLTDVFQEENGLYTFDRRPKFDLARLRAVQCRPAAYEQGENGHVESEPQTQPLVEPAPAPEAPLISEAAGPIPALVTAMPAGGNGYH